MMNRIATLLAFFCFLGLSQISLGNPELVGEWEQLSYACVDGTTTISVHPFDRGQKASLDVTSTGSTTGNATLKWTELAVGSVLDDQLEHVRNCDEDTGVFTPDQCVEHRSKLAQMQDTGIHCTIAHEATYSASSGYIAVTISSTTSEGCTPSGSIDGQTFGFTYSIASNRLYLSPDNTIGAPFTCATGKPTIVLIKM